MKSIVVYTAIMDGKDKLQEIPGEHPDCDFVCFTDDKTLTSNTWNVVHVNPISINPVLNAKPFKLVPHRYFPNYIYSLWMDGNFIPKPELNIKEFINTYLVDSDIASFRHLNSTDEFKNSVHYRNCLYREAEVCIQYPLDDPYKIIAQIERYRAEGYPENNGLRNCGVLLRRHNAIKHVMNAWWVEMTLGSIRDQISFPYILWKYKLKITDFKGTIDNNNLYFTSIKHAKDGVNNNNQLYSSWLGDIGHSLRNENIDIFGLYKKLNIPFSTWYEEGKSPQEVIDIVKSM